MTRAQIMQKVHQGATKAANTMTTVTKHQEFTANIWHFCTSWNCEIYVTLMQGKFMSATKLCCWVHKLCLLVQYLLEKGKFFHYLIFEIHIILRKRLLFTAELVISQQAIYIPHHFVCSTSKLNLLRRKKRNT